MRDEYKTKEQLIDELRELRKQNAELEKSEGERMQAEEERRESESKWRLLVENSPDFIYMADSDGKVLFINRTYPEHSEDEVIGKNIYDFLAPKYHNEMRIRLKNIFQKGSTDPLESGMLRRDGTQIFFETRYVAIKHGGKVASMMGIATDITERKQTEEALRRREQEIRIIADNVPALVSYVDAHGHYRFVNKQYKEWFGVPRSEIIGKHYSQILGEATYEHIKDSVGAALSGQRVSYEDALPYLLGGTRWVMADYVPDTDDQGKVKGFFALVTDITKRKKAEEELKKYHTHLEDMVEERTKKLEDANVELEMFAHSVSHDLRAPLRAMQGFAQALQEDYGSKLDARGREYAERIINASAHMDAMIQDLLAYSQLSKTEIKLKSVSLKLIVEETMDQLEVEIEERNADVNIETPLPKVKGQHLVLTVVLSNILKNAITFVAPGVKPKVKIWAEERNGWIRLNVEDNGIGIAPEHHEIIFRIFERLHSIETYPGTGIGLAFVKRGLERMRGKVGVESEIGKGSQFWIELKKGKVKK